MKTCVGCGTYIPDPAAFCPSCGGGQAPGAAPAPVLDRTAAEDRVRTLGVLYMVLAGIDVLATIANFAQIWLMSRQELDGAPDETTFLLAFGGVLVVSLAIAAFILWTGWRLRELRGRSAAVGAAVVMIVGSPCGCCLLSIPLGIWALLLLHRDETRAVMDRGR